MEMTNVVPFALRLSTPAERGRDVRVLGTLRVSRSGRVRAEAVDSDLQPYLTDMAEKLNKRVVTVSMIGPLADGSFDSWNHVVEHDDPEFPAALRLRVEGEYGLIVDEAA